MPAPDLRAMNIDELKELMREAGQEPYRAEQVFKWVHKRCARSTGEMTDLSKTLRQWLSDNCGLTSLKEINVQRSAADGTAKYLFALSDGNLIESVTMPYSFGTSVCISSQAGCAMGCAFCASGADGIIRSLTAAEMLDQVYAVKEEPARVVVMGIGEPLLNYEELCRFISLLTDERGRNMGKRHITVSTCGIVPRIKDFGKDHPQTGLAVSLHAPTQEKRERIMPVARTWSLKELMEACVYYTRITNRLITFEYALIAGFNDSQEDAHNLAELVKDISCVVNLIPVNPAIDKSLTGTKRTGVLSFKKNLEKMGINVTIRREMGRDIDGACGQLRRRALNETMLPENLN